ncbi:MAG: hypothetical protein L0229_00160 [Blastocatellia bacterium]|nr:hypothetical protein [Blastocatellia bacterium]
MEGINKLIEHAATAGLTLSVEGAELVIEGLESDESLALAILARKAEVIAALSGDPELPVYDFTPIEVDGPMRCHSDGCLGWVKLLGGRGVCDRCGLSHRIVSRLAPVVIARDTP